MCPPVPPPVIRTFMIVTMASAFSRKTPFLQRITGRHAGSKAGGAAVSAGFFGSGGSIGRAFGSAFEGGYRGIRDGRIRSREVLALPCAMCAFCGSDGYGCPCFPTEAYTDMSASVIRRKNRIKAPSEAKQIRALAGGIIPYRKRSGICSEAFRLPPSESAGKSRHS